MAALGSPLLLPALAGLPRRGPRRFPARPPRVGRCEGEVAIRTIEADHARDGHYPPDIHTMAVDSDRYESPSCPIYQNVDWLYRSGSQGYTVGYWNDWLLLGKHICLHTSGHQGWNCGLNQWGPFRPGETG